jgi:hypothetical protein
VTLQLAVLFSSVAGAFLFYLGGYLIGRGGRVAKAAIPSAPPEPPPGNTVSGAAEAEPQGAVVDQARRSLELDALRQEGEACRSRLLAVEQERGTLEKENQRLIKEKERLQGLVDKGSIDPDLEQLKEKASQVDALREEKFDLSVRLKQLQELNRVLQKQTERMKELEDERHASNLKMESQERHVAALERLKEENARLSTLVSEIPELRSAVESLTAENRELRSLGLVHKPSPRPGQTSLPEDLGGSMQALLDRLDARLGAGGRGTALADEQGLLVAGTSEYSEGLAVTAALCDGLMRQVSEILPLTTLSRFTMVDTSSNAATVCPFRVGSDGLLLATLSVGTVPSNEIFDDIVGQASVLIGGGEKQ